MNHILDKAITDKSIFESSRNTFQNRIFKTIKNIPAIIFLAGILAALYLAWINRTDPAWIPDSGLGYYFGIAGGSMMLLLLLYPMRKYMRSMNGLLPIKYWFRTHMIFGLLGPALVLIHSNYQLGSINGRVALFSMLAVAISGLFGRYIYRQIHHGLYGKKVTFSERRTESTLLTRKLGDLLKLKPEIATKLVTLEEHALDLPPGIIRSFIKLSLFRIGSASTYRNIVSDLGLELSRNQSKSGWSSDKLKSHKKTTRILMRSHRQAILQLAEYHFYERLFSIWHVLHLPLFIMMVITGFIHVYAVHVY